MKNNLNLLVQVTIIFMHNLLNSVLKQIICRMNLD